MSITTRHGPTPGRSGIKAMRCGISSVIRGFPTALYADVQQRGPAGKNCDCGDHLFADYLVNSGTVQAQSGTIEFSGGSDLGGTFQADEDGAIYFDGGNFDISSTLSNFHGSGLIELVGGASVTLTNFAGTFDLDGASLAGQSTLAGRSTLNWYGGQLNPGASLTVASNAVMNIEGSIQIVGVLTNAGTVNWEAGDVDVIYYPYDGYTGEIWNQTNGVWDMACDQTLNNNYDLATFHNAGNLLKSADGGTTSFNLYLNNSGVVEGQSGTIDFGGGSDLGGIFQADEDGAIYFDGGNFDISSTLSNFHGPGLIELVGGASVTLTNFAGTFDLDGASLAGQSTLAGGSTLNWYGGQLNPGASLTVASNAVMNIEEASKLWVC